MLFEMLTGQPPFVGRNPSQLLAAHVTEAPEPIGRRRPNLPPALAALVMRCLEKRAADRPQSASEIVHALDDITTPSGGMQPTTAGERVAGTSNAALAAQDASTSASGRRLPTGGVVLAIVVTALAVLGVVVWRRGPVAGEPGAGPTRVAVLPFENLGDSADAYFADGITDAVRGKLSELPTLQVTARSSAGQYRHSTKTPRDIGNELGVQYILTATVRWEKQTGGASRVQVSPELVQVSTASTKWQQPFDASMTDVFQEQADIAGRVASSLNVALGDQAKAQLAVRPTANIPAYDAFLKGEEISNRMSENDPAVLRRAADYYEQATALDPTFALAWAQLARSHAIIYFNGVPSPEEADAAKRAAERALVLAPDRPESHLAMGAYYSNIPKDYARELAEYESTLRTAPADADLLTAAALAEESLGRWDDALKHLEQATRLDPRSPLPARRLGTVRQYQRRFPEALAAFDHALQLAPTNFAALEGKMMVSLAQGDLAGARAVLAGAGTGIDPAKLVAYIANYQDLFWVLDDAQQQLLLRLSPTPFDEDRSAWGVALTETYALRGDQTKARAYADSALISIDAQLRATPDDAQRHSIRGLVLAYLGRKAEAIAEGERGVTLMPVSKDAFLGAYLQHELVRIYLLVNEPEKALAHLEPLLRIPYALSPGWLRIDPTFAPLKGNPRFERLVAGR
jgi:serine/threonine-protein kinase